MAVNNQVVGVIGANSQLIGPFTAESGFGNLVFHITGTWSGTIGFFCGTDGVVGNIQPLALYASNAAPGTIVTGTTANGLWSTIDATGKNVYLQSTAWATGSAVVNMSVNSIS